MRATSWIPREGNVAIPENEMKKPRARALRARPRRREAMDDAARFGDTLSSSSAAVSSSASRVWMMTGQADVARQPDLSPKRLALHVSGRVVVVKVQADLADRGDPPFARESPQLVVDGLGREARLVGVYAGRHRQAEPFG